VEYYNHTRLNQHKNNYTSEDLGHFALKTPKWQRYLHSFTPTLWAFSMKKDLKWDIN
jgi:hypothetical protein